MRVADYRVGAALLAAGESRRFGQRNKLLVDIGGRPMVRHTAGALLRSRAEPIVVVTGHDGDRIAEAVAGLAVDVVYNPDYASGMSTTLRVGVAALGSGPVPPVDGALICLADMPWVRAEHLDALIEAFDPAGGRPICAPVYDRKRGNPVLWAASYFEQIGEVSGDVGARALLDQHAACVHAVPFGDAGVVRDVDESDQLPGPE